MKPRKLFALTVVVLAASLVGCVSTSRYRELQEKYDRDTVDLQATADSLRRRIGDLEKSGMIDKKTLDIERLERERLARQLEEYTKGIPGVAYEEGRIRMEGDYFFDPGMASMKKEAKASLDRLSDALAKLEGRILVVGHTDSDPIDKSKKMWTTGLNHELGANRALQVIAYLIGKGISRDKFVVSSPGEFEPAAPNDTKEGKKKNRRVEIFHLSPTPSK